MPLLDTPKTPGLLKLKAQAGGTGPVEINDGQKFVNKVATAAGMHKVQRWQGEGSKVTVTTEGGSMLSITPAGSEDEFLQQKNNLVLAFENEVGRAPSMENGTSDDTVFWETLAALADAYTGPTLNAAAVMNGLS